MSKPEQRIKLSFERLTAALNSNVAADIRRFGNDRADDDSQHSLLTRMLRWYARLEAAAR